MSDLDTDRVVRLSGAEIDPNELAFEPFWKKPVKVEATPMPDPFTVETPEGTMEGEAGDILISGVEDELYPCDKEVFYQTYIPDEEDVPKYTESDLQDAMRELRHNTLDHVPIGTLDTDARSGARALLEILRKQK